MPRAEDGPTTVPESVACEIAGLSPAKRRDWVKKKVLDQPKTKARLTELQVIELAVLRELHDIVGPRDAPIAWREIRDGLRERILVPQLDAVIDVGYREALLVSSDEELALAVRSARAVRVVPLAALVRRVRDAFRRLTAPASKAAAAETRQKPRANMDAG